MKTITVSPEETEAAKPDWLRASEDKALHELYECSLEWRAEMHRAADVDTQARIQRFAHEWDTARHTITLAEAERRWNRSNLRQNPLHLPFRWQSEDGRGTWLTTTYVMEACFGKESIQPRKEN